MTAPIDTSDREIVIRRTIAAPLARVWQAWTDPDEVAQWWGPDGFTTTTDSFDLRSGGMWRFTMHGPMPNGEVRDFPNRIIYQEVDPPHRLVYTHDDDTDGNAPDSITFITTVTFEPDGENTKVTLRSVFPSSDERDRVAREFGAVEGGIQHLGRLAAQITECLTGPLSLTTAHPNDCEIILARVFNAPRKTLWQAFTEPEHVAQWFGPRGFTTRVEELDLRPGGKSRYVMVGPDNKEYPCEGVFREIVEGQRIVSTDEFGDDYDSQGVDLPQGIILTTTFEDIPGSPGQSRLLLRITHPTADDCRKHESMGVIAGWNSSLDCLDEKFANK